MRILVALMLFVAACQCDKNARSIAGCRFLRSMRSSAINRWPMYPVEVCKGQGCVLLCILAAEKSE